MEPVSIIVAALAGGAAAGLKGVADKVVGDAYDALKALLGRRFGSVDTAPVEKKPESDGARAYVGEGLAEAGADADAEVLAAARRLIELLEERAPQVGQAIGVDLRKVKAAAIDVSDVSATGENATGARLHEVEAQGEIRLSGIRAEGGGGRANP